MNSFKKDIFKVALLCSTFLSGCGDKKTLHLMQFAGIHNRSYMDEVAINDSTFKDTLVKQYVGFAYIIDADKNKLDSMNIEIPEEVYKKYKMKWVQKAGCEEDSTLIKPNRFCIAEIIDGKLTREKTIDSSKAVLGTYQDMINQENPDPEKIFSRNFH